MIILRLIQTTLHELDIWEVFLIRNTGLWFKLGSNYIVRMLSGKMTTYFHQRSDPK